MFARYFQINHALLSENISPANQILSYPAVINTWSISELEGLAGLQSEVARQAAMIAYNNCFLACWVRIPIHCINS